MTYTEPLVKIMLAYLQTTQLYFMESKSDNINKIGKNKVYRLTHLLCEKWINYE